MTKEELIKAIQDYPDDAEVMTQPDLISRWDIADVFYDEKRQTIVIV